MLGDFGDLFVLRAWVTYLIVVGVQILWICCGFDFVVCLFRVVFCCFGCFGVCVSGLIYFAVGFIV